ncbi:MAG TPA: hypothetical protein VIJ09_09320 [Acidimicrobiales bacterium]
MRAVAWVGGLVIVAGLVFMAVAGFPGAIPILVSAGALVAMVGLGGAMGGRHTANVSPVATRPSVGSPPPPESVPPDDDAGGATAEP